MATNTVTEAAKNTAMVQPSNQVVQNPFQNGNNVFFLSMLVFMLALWFFAGRKQKKREKEEAAIRKDIEVGDEVVTVGGIVGIVTSVKDSVFTLETGGDRSKLRIEKSAIKSNVTAAERMAKQKEIENAKGRKRK
ncbi:MAG: preprotein translocase subunit YajC [Oscillospiraceae bacterium]|jgi:preprotein translocase subunit YajC|nr:preprotein translocase subunit YajC [Oscillospiraceae bacterium]